MKGILRNKLELNPSMGELVLQHLKERVDLDPMVNHLLNQACHDVIVAGQAVASAVSEMFGDASCVVYNDVDAFVLMKSYARSAMLGPAKDRRRNVVHTLKHEKVAVVQSAYGHLTANSEGVYQVLETHRRDLLNEVLCLYEPRYLKFHAAEAARFLSTFDLNCVQVGVRLSDKALVWTPAFARFCATRELLVENVRTPVHTAIRWFKKKAELEGLYGHDERAMQLLGLAAHQVHMLQNGAPGSIFGGFMHGQQDSSQRRARTLASRLVFSHTYKARLDEVRGALSRYFSLQPLQNTRIALYTLQPTFEFQIDGKDIWRLPEAFLPTYVRARQGFWRKHVCEKILEVGRQLNRPFEELAGKDIFTAQVACERGPSTVVPPHAKEFASVCKVFSEHGNLLKLSRLLPYETLPATMHALQELAQELGPHVFGFVETNLDRLVQAVYSLNTPVELADVRSAIREVVAAIGREADEMASKGQFLLRQGFAPLQLHGFEVRELRHPKDLVVEGFRMHHCVGGFIHAVLGGQCAIVQMRKHRTQDSLTLEIVRRTQIRASARGPLSHLTRASLTIGQLRGLGNRSATSAEMEAAERLVRALNLKLTFRRLDVFPMAVYLAMARHDPKTPLGRIVDAMGSSYSVSLSRIGYRLKQAWLQRKTSIRQGALKAQTLDDPLDFPF